MGIAGALSDATAMRRGADRYSHPYKPTPPQWRLSNKRASIQSFHPYLICEY